MKNGIFVCKQINNIFLLTKIEILPCVVTIHGIELLWYLLSLDEQPLLNAWVHDTRFVHVDSAVGEVVVNCAFSYAVVLIRILNDTFLEVGIKPKDLTIVLQPRRLDSWDVIVDWCLT